MPTLGCSPVPEVLTMVMILRRSLIIQGADSIAHRTFIPELVRALRGCVFFSFFVAWCAGREGLWCD